MPQDLSKNELRAIPAVALRGSVVFPDVISFLNFGRPKSKLSVREAFEGEKLLAVFTQKSQRVVNPTPDDLYQVGAIVSIQDLMPVDDDIHVMVKGVARCRVSEVISEEPFLVTKVEEVADESVDKDEEEALARHLSELFKKSVQLGKQVEVQTVMKLVSSVLSPTEIANQVAYLLDIRTVEKQELLEMTPVKDRLEKVTDYLAHEVNVLDLERTISAKTQKRFEEQMKKAMLAERKKTIEQELRGLEGEEADEIEELRAKIVKAKMSKEVRKKAEKELSRLAAMSMHNPESGYIRNYLDWLVEMPWSKLSENHVTIQKAADQLDEDHYALKPVKERILEYLAVLQLKGGLGSKKQVLVPKKKKKDKNGESYPTILCFIGPPGVGKTSIGRSIARALGREFVRVSLGGIRDEAEVRGHRRTYVGALPGRIVQGIRNAGTKNPVFMLDEIDKIGTDFRGDPSSALLEALDPEQNKEFSDHYLEVPFDLSQVIFICTGNVLDGIPPALRDRMEIIRFSGYTEDEKYKIAKQFLWPKQLVANGLSARKMDISPAALHEVISRYTREAGVRDLERNLATICRKIARNVSEKKKVGKTVKVADVRKYLGPPKYRSLLAERVDEIGMSTGLAVTATGGEIIFVETALMPGKGKLTLTGQLGDVMKESAQAAFSYARSQWRRLGLRQDFAKKLDIHVHVPEGAVQKDGPSAGIAMATSLVSSLTNTATRREVGMTGEITLRGRVLEIGGVKEKVIAGHRAGLKTIVLPKDNKKDMEEIPDKVKKDIKFVFVEHLDEVLEVAFKSAPRKRQIEAPPYLPASTYAAS